MADFRDERNQTHRFGAARAQIRLDSNYRFVSLEHYYELMVSNSKLQRIELQHADLIGLSDPLTGICYVIEAEELGTDRTW